MGHESLLHDLVVEDVTDELEEADSQDLASGQMPYELEEPPSDEETDTAQAIPASEMTLIQDLRSLRCETPERLDIRGSMTTPIKTRKRTRADMSSESGEETAVAKVLNYAKRQKKFTSHQEEGANSRSQPAQNDNDSMDLDEEQVTSAASVWKDDLSA